MTDSALQLLTRTAALTFFAGAVMAIWTFMLFDRLLRLLVAENREEWERLGRPIGFFWIPKGGSLLQGGLVRAGLVFQWAARMPDWMAAIPRAVEWQRRFKRASFWSRMAFGTFLAEVALGGALVVW